MKIKTYALLLALGSALGFVLTGSAATRYVAITNAAPAWPYTNWATAACVIQDAVDAADPGDEILVADGVYATGGRAVYGTMTNRVAIDKAVIVRSVNGPNLTWIVGQGAGGAGNHQRRWCDSVRVRGDQRGVERVHPDQRAHPKQWGLLQRTERWGSVVRGEWSCSPTAP